MNDVDAARLLLTFLFDALPAPRGPRPAADPGEVPSRDIACPDCGGDAARWRGWRRVRSLAETRGSLSRRDDASGWWIPCERCGGDAVRGIAGKGYVAIDSYTLREVTSATTYAAPGPQRYRRLTCLDCSGWGAHHSGKRCRTCAGEGAYDVPVYDDSASEGGPRERSSDALLIAARASGAVVSAGLWDRGSFGAIQSALSHLAPWRRLLLWRAYVSSEMPPAALPEAQAAALRSALHDLAQDARKLAGGRLRVPAELREWDSDRRIERVHGTGRHANSYAQGQRNKEIRKLASEGWSTRRLGDAFGLSKTAIANVLRSAVTSATAVASQTPADDRVTP